jgi:hypothetical protein
MATASVSWHRLFVEGGAIVVSILLAFAIDAWWQQRQELAGDNAHLKGVYEELETHKSLISEAIEAHTKTLDAGMRLLEIISETEEAADAAEITELIDGLINFYQINAPFGSLETAISSGAIARMRDTALASSLASWPTAIEDLLEEELVGGEIVAFQFLPHLAGRMPLAEVYRLRLEMPSARGIDIVQRIIMDDLPPSAHTTSYSALFNDYTTENEILQVMVWAQSGLAEAVLFDEKLDRLMSELDACLNRYSC